MIRVEDGRAYDARRGDAAAAVFAPPLAMAPVSAVAAAVVEAPVAAPLAAADPTTVAPATGGKCRKASLQHELIGGEGEQIIGEPANGAVLHKTRRRLPHRDAVVWLHLERGSVHDTSAEAAVAVTASAGGRGRGAGPATL